MKIEVRTIKKKDYEKAHALQCEYLDEETYSAFVQRVNRNPDLYFVAVDGDEMVGICYGDPSEKEESAVHLQGIAVNLDENKGYARVGIGSNLIHAFENAVKNRRYKVIGVGSADDPKVEAFYLKNGFKPKELVVKDSRHEELERIRMADYEIGKMRKEELRRDYNPREVIFIFEKVLD